MDFQPDHAKLNRSYFDGSVLSWNFERFQKCYHELNSKLIIFREVVHRARGFKISVKPHILKTVGRKILVRTSVYYVEKALVALEIE